MSLLKALVGALSVLALVPQFGSGPDQRVGHRHHSDLVPQILLEPVHTCA